MIVRDMLTSLLKSPVTVFAGFINKTKLSRKNYYHLSNILSLFLRISYLSSVNLVVLSVPRMDDRLGKSKPMHLYSKTIRGPSRFSKVLQMSHMY